MTSEDSEPATEFARRLWEVMAEEKKSPTRTEREAELQRGYMSQLKSGKIRSPGPEVIRALADYLGVGYEWLAIGRGPKRSEGWAPSALERATSFALEHGARRDAIEAATERYRDAAENMSGTDWILAFNTEAVRLDREGVPRPEAVEAKQRAMRRALKKRARQAVQKRVRAVHDEATAREAARADLGTPRPARARAKS